MYNFIIVFISIFLSTCLQFSQGKRVEGNLGTTENWQFITRFCFLSKKGTLQYFFEYPKSYERQDLLLYFDNKWDDAYKTGKSCKEKVDLLSWADNQIIALDSNGVGNCTTILKAGNVSYWSCYRKVTFSSMRAKWWFIAIGNCQSAKGLKIVYSLHMMNGDEGDLLHHENSADQFYILPIIISFFIVYMGLGALSSAVGFVLSTQQLFHTTYKMYIFSLYTNCFGLFILVIGYGKYANTGYEETGAWLAGRLFQSISDIVFVLMLVLMSNGYTIVRGKLSAPIYIALTVFTILFTITYAVLFIYEAEVFDQGEVLYIYESPGGYALISLRLVGWTFFCVSLIINIVTHSRKTWFYIPFFIYYTIWFWAGPITILISMFVIDLWVREQVVIGVSNFVTLCGHLFFLLITRPEKANKNFPYHIKTTQIGMMDGTEKESDANSPYEVPEAETMNIHGPDLHSLFVTDRRSSKTQFSEETTTSETFPKERNGILPSLMNNNIPPLATNGKTNGRVPKLDSEGQNGTKLPRIGRAGALPPIQKDTETTPSAPQVPYDMFNASQQNVVNGENN